MALITMHKYNQDDFDVFRSLTDDDDVMKYVSGEGLSEEKAKAKFASILHVNSTQNSLGYFKIYNDQNIFIGDCNLAEKTKPGMNIIGNIDPENIASKRLLEKFGFSSYTTATIDGMITESLMLTKKSGNEY